MKLANLWYRHSILSYFLLPLSWLFWIIITIRRWLYRLHIKKIYYFPVPIIVVGNITVGGAGKTPLVIWLADLLRQQGFNPGIISRGYRAKHCKQPTMVTSNSKATAVGDEPLMIARRTKCPIIIFPRREQAIELLIKQHGCDVIISDDGLQHYAMARDIEIAVIDAQRKFGNGFLLPAGPLRESIARLKSVDFVIHNGTDMHLIPAVVLSSVGNSGKHLKISSLYQQKIHAVAGIGNPQRFFDTLRKLNLQIVEHPFPDHHNFTASDIDYGDETVIMTEKDAVKCTDFAKDNHWFLPVTAKLQPNFTDMLLSRLADCVTTKDITC